MSDIDFTDPAAITAALRDSFSQDAAFEREAAMARQVAAGFEPDETVVEPVAPAPAPAPAVEQAAPAPIAPAPTLDITTDNLADAEDDEFDDTDDELDPPAGQKFIVVGSDRAVGGKVSAPEGGDSVPVAPSGAEGSDPVVDPTLAPTPAPSPAPAAPPAFDLTAFASQVYGRPPTAEEAMDIIAWYNTRSQMSPAQQQALNAMLAGDNAGAAAALGVTLPSQQLAGSPAPTPAPAPDPYASPWDDPTQQPVAPMDPATAARLAQIEAQQQAILADAQRREQEAQAQHAAQAQQQALAARDAFVAKYQDTLSQEEMAALMMTVNQNIGLVNQRAAANGFDYAEAYGGTLEALMFAQPELKQRVIDRQVEAQRLAEQQTQVDDTQRQRKAAAVAGAPTSPAAVERVMSPVGAPRNQPARTTKLPRVASRAASGGMVVADADIDKALAAALDKELAGQG